MKRILLISFVIIALTAGFGHAQKGSGIIESQQKGESAMMEGQGMIDQGMIPVMKHMTLHGMMMQETMHRIKDVMKMQRKMMMNPPDGEKERMMREMDHMIENMDKLMSEMRDMMIHMMGYVDKGTFSQEKKGK